MHTVSLNAPMSAGRSMTVMEKNSNSARVVGERTASMEADDLEAMP